MRASEGGLAKPAASSGERSGAARWTGESHQLAAVIGLSDDFAQFRVADGQRTDPSFEPVIGGFGELEQCPKPLHRRVAGRGGSAYGLALVIRPGPGDGAGQFLYPLEMVIE